jgi:hypothetical protein
MSNSFSESSTEAVGAKAQCGRRDAQVQKATIMSNKVLTPPRPHNKKAAMQSTKAAIPVDHSSQ